MHTPNTIQNNDKLGKWKLPLIYLILFIIILGVIFIRIFTMNSEPELPSVRDNATELMCKNTGGKMGNFSCGSICWKGYPATKGERIQEETSIIGHNCPYDSCTQKLQCACLNGKYFGSIEEGCIDESERKHPPKSKN